MEKGEIAHFEQFHLFPQCFPKPFFFNVLKSVHVYMEERVNASFNIILLYPMVCAPIHLFLEFLLLVLLPMPVAVFPETSIIPFPNKPCLYLSAVQAFWKHWEKGKIAHNKCFLPVWITFCHFLQILKCCLQSLSIWTSLKFVVW